MRPKIVPTKTRITAVNKKIKRKKSRINCYANCVATFNLALSGDIELNPGPGSNPRNSTSKCSFCNKGVGTNRKGLQCSRCRNLTHFTCSNIPKTEQNTILRELFIHGFVVTALYLSTTVEISICRYLITLTTMYPYFKTNTIKSLMNTLNTRLLPISILKL